MPNHDDTPPKPRRGAPHGNKNAKGHGAAKIGNQHALKGSAPALSRSFRLTPEALADLATARDLSEARSDSDTIATALRRHVRALKRKAR